MNKRQKSVNKAIIIAIDRDYGPAKISALTRFWVFWHLFHTRLVRYGTEFLGDVRADTWKIDPEEYKKSFQSHGKSQDALLKPIGDLGYSGSVRFNSKPHP